MDRVLPVVVVLGVLVLVFGAMAVAWRSRRRSQRALGPVPAPPAALGDPSLVAPALYLATTRADAPLERIAVEGLGFRARATVAVHDAGVVLSLAGQPPRFVARERLVAAGRANWTIDRASGGDRLVFLRWVIGDGAAATEVDSYLRGDDPAALLDALAGAVPASTPKETPHDA